MNREDNERLTRTGPGTPMGELFRRYWLPALASDELPEPDCPPVRIPLLGERLIAFRDSAGQVGILEEACAHRQASLYFGRCEAGGIRCPYHGWKFDTRGRCLEIPAEPAESGFFEQIRLKAYPVLESGSVIWVYMGRPELMPTPPALEWASLPAAQVFVSKRLQECNYFQTMEGGLDSSHLSFLHRGTIQRDPVLGTRGAGHDTRIVDIIAGDTNPRYEVAETAGGALLGARRNAGDGNYYWRITQFVAPCFNIIAPTGDLSLNAQAWVPLDDRSCWSWAVNYYLDRPIADSEREQMRRGGGLHVEFVPGTHQGRANLANDYLMDRVAPDSAQKQGLSFTGIAGVAMQDTAVQESQGPIADRTLEHLVSSDNGIIAVRNMLLRAARDNAQGSTIPGLEPHCQAVRAASIFSREARLERVPMDELGPLARALP